MDLEEAQELEVGDRVGIVEDGVVTDGPFIVQDIEWYGEFEYEDSADVTMSKDNDEAITVNIYTLIPWKKGHFVGGPSNVKAAKDRLEKTMSKKVEEQKLSHVFAAKGINTQDGPVNIVRKFLDLKKPINFRKTRKIRKTRKTRKQRSTCTRRRINM